jgi:hypothetical protein
MFTLIEQFSILGSQGYCTRSPPVVPPGAGVSFLDEADDEGTTSDKPEEASLPSRDLRLTFFNPLRDFLPTLQPPRDQRPERVNPDPYRFSHFAPHRIRRPHQPQ